MMTIERGSRLTALIFVLAGLMFAPNTFADYDGILKTNKLNPVI